MSVRSLLLAAAAGGGPPPGPPVAGDASTWTARSPGIGAFPLYALAYGAGRFVALAYNSSQSITSADGVTWAPNALPSSQLWYSLAFGNGLFVATLNGTTTVYFTSPNGLTWTQRALPVSGTNAVAYFAGGRFFIPVGTTMLSSADGLVWTQSSTLPNSMSGNTGVAFGNGVYVTRQNSSTAVARSTDGTTWTAANGAYNYNNTLAFGGTGNLFVAMGVNGISESSSDGVTWNAIGTAPTGTWRPVAWGGQVFLWVAASGQNVITSTNGTTWTTVATGVTNPQWTSIAVGPGRWVVSGATGSGLMSSP